jgi:YbbR domain-containing protein
VRARDFVRRHLLHNLGLKLTASLLAIGLWLAVASNPSSEVALSVPIILRSMPADVEVSSEKIPEAQVRIRGPERVIRRLQASDVHVEIDVSGVKPGERTFDLTRAISVPDRLEVAQVVPSEVHLVFDTRTVRRVPVKPRVTGTFATGYEIGQIESDPVDVELIGPKKQIDVIESAVTDPIDVTGVLDRVTVTRPAYVSDPLIQVTNPQPVRITITMQKEKPKT